MSTNHSTRPAPSASPYNPTEEMNAHPDPGAAGAASAALPHAYGVHTTCPRQLPPMPIYLGAQNTPAQAPAQASPETEGGRPLQGLFHPGASRSGAGSSGSTREAYDPRTLLRHLVLLLGILLSLTLWLGGYRPGLSDARLGWSHGSISVIKGTDGDTGAHPLDPHDEGVRPARPNATLRSVSPSGPTHPVEMGKTFFGDTSRLAPSVQPWSGGSEA